MAITDLPLLGMLKTKMSWHQERQRVLAENVANADTPKYRARDLEPPSFRRDQSVGSLGLTRTSSGHIVMSGGDASAFRSSRAGGSDIRPSGNAVNLEDEMLKVASNQMDYQAATTLYSKSLGLLKTAVGKR